MEQSQRSTQPSRRQVLVMLFVVVLYVGSIIGNIFALGRSPLMSPPSQWPRLLWLVSSATFSLLSSVMFVRSVRRRGPPNERVRWGVLVGVGLSSFFARLFHTPVLDKMALGMGMIAALAMLLVYVRELTIARQG